MKNKIDEILRQVETFTTDSLDQVEELRIKYLSKKGIIPSLFNDFKDVAAEERKEIGMALNELKNKAQDRINLLKEELQSRTSGKAEKEPDLTMPVDFSELGARHPLSIVRRQILDIFHALVLPFPKVPKSKTTGITFRRLISPKSTLPAICRTPFLLTTAPEVPIKLPSARTLHQCRCA